METPVPSRRITRSQASILSIKNNNKGLENEKNEESDNFVMKSRQKKNVKKHQEKEKSALFDITNGSPIVGLAMGSLKTPSSRCSKKRMVVNSESKRNMTPGSGESLLRGQVKTLLQKVEEEGVVSRACFEPNVWCCDPANTPHFSASGNHGLKPFIVSHVAESCNFTQMLNEVVSAQCQENKSERVEKDVITRSLFSDFSEKSHDSDSNGSSLWSVQLNVSSSDEYKEYEEMVVDELCEGMSRVSVNKAATFTGKHIRFVYNSDGELEGAVSSSSKTVDRQKEE